MFGRLRARLRDEQGMAAIIIALCLTVFSALVALSVDLGMLYVARSETQRAADAAALAALTALIEDPNDVDRARRAAIEFAAQNTVRGVPVVLEPEDVEISMGDDTTVVVNVIRSSARGTPIRTLFARAVGIAEVDVGSDALSGPEPAGDVTCMKPFMIPDMWDDANSNGRYDDGELYDPQVTGYGTTFRNDGFANDIGRPVVLYPGNPENAMQPSFFFLYRMPGMTGGADIRESIANPSCNPTLISIGDRFFVEPGLKRGAVSDAVQSLVDADPSAFWDPLSQRIQGSAYGDAWGASPRVIRIPLFDPSRLGRPGRRELNVSNMATVFVESTTNDVVMGRLLPALGVGTDRDCEATNSCSAFAKYPRLLR